MDTSDKATRERAERVIRAHEITGNGASLTAQCASDVLRLMDERDEARLVYKLLISNLSETDLKEWKRLREKAKLEGWLP